MHKCAHVHECTVLWQQVCPLHTTEVNQLLPLSQEKQLKRFIVSATSASVFLPKTKSRTPNPPCHPYPCSSFYFVVQIAGIIRNQQKDAMQSQTLFLKKGRKKQKDLIIVTTCLFFAFLNLCAHTLAVSAETYRQRQVFRQGFENSSNLSDHLIVVRAEGQRTFAHLSLIDKELKHYKNRQGCVI